MRNYIVDSDFDYRMATEYNWVNWLYFRCGPQRLSNKSIYGQVGKKQTGSNEAQLKTNITFDP